jgi:chromosome transmission fidelity protein 1
MAVPEQDFGFPFTPYPIQEDFMKTLYNVLDQGKVGIFESPTGTVRCCKMCSNLRISVILLIQFT